MGEEGVWNAALIFATFFPAFVLILNWYPLVYAGSLFASKYTEYVLIIKPTRCTNFSDLFLE